jgi:hypothetical protein
MKTPNFTYQQKLLKEYSIATVNVRNGIIEIFCKEFITIHSRDLTQFMKELQRDIRAVNTFKFITHIYPTTIFTAQTRLFYLKTLNKKFKLAEAIVTENISQQFILETLLDKITIDIPVKIFETREEAMKWIKHF